MDSIIPLLPKSKISSLKPSPVAVQNLQRWFSYEAAHILDQSGLTLSFNPLETIVHSNPYHLDESTFILGTSKVLSHLISFVDEIHVSKQNKPQTGRWVLRRHLWDYSVCLCAQRRALEDLYGLKVVYIFQIYFK